MNKLTKKRTYHTIKEISLVLVFAGTLMGISLNVSANYTPDAGIEDAVNDFIFYQSEKLGNELKAQLQQSINSEVKKFSINLPLTLWNEMEEVNQSIQQSNETKSKNPVSTHAISKQSI